MPDSLAGKKALLGLGPVQLKRVLTLLEKCCKATDYLWSKNPIKKANSN